MINCSSDLAQTSKNAKKCKTNKLRSCGGFLSFLDWSKYNISKPSWYDLGVPTFSTENIVVSPDEPKQQERDPKYLHGC